MDWQSFASALALMMIFEGISPFLMPERMRKLAAMLIEASDRSIRHGRFSQHVGRLSTFVLDSRLAFVNIAVCSVKTRQKFSTVVKLKNNTGKADSNHDKSR
jgi:uncharacterized protein YjeT (DUF2065 family)